MKWTKDNPTEPGWYWYRDEDGPRCLRLYHEDGEIVVEIDWIYERSELLDEYEGGEWQGPIKPEEG